jgi:hypothetical protein
VFSACYVVPPNTYIDVIGRHGRGTFVYQICEQGAEICSNEASATFDRGRKRN